MKPFESFLASYLEEYIMYRHGLGYEDTNLRSSLSQLDQYLTAKDADWDHITPSFFLHFRAQLKAGPCRVNRIFMALRGFFHYLIRKDCLDKNPLADIPKQKELSFIPFVFSPIQIEQLMTAIQKRIRKDNNKHFFNDLAEYIAILLLTRCGLRISEPTKVFHASYRAKEATIYIQKTKFKKDRLLPIPKAVVGEIENYLAVRKSLLDEDQSPYLLVRWKQKRLNRNQIAALFHQAVNDIGLAQPTRTIGTTTFGRPTPHSLRHSFAVNTLKRIKEAGKSPQAALPILSAYMGHRCYQDTAVYLKVLDAQQRLELVNFALSRRNI
jgi:site-specific recombinase XerD